MIAQIQTDNHFQLERNRVVKRNLGMQMPRIISIKPLNDGTYSKAKEFYNTLVSITEIKKSFPDQRMVHEIYGLSDTEYKMLLDQNPLGTIDQVSKFFYEPIAGAVIICHKQT